MQLIFQHKIHLSNTIYATNKLNDKSTSLFHVGYSYPIIILFIAAIIRNIHQAPYSLLMTFFTKRFNTGKNHERRKKIGLCVESCSYLQHRDHQSCHLSASANNNITEKLHE